MAARAASAPGQTNLRSASDRKFGSPVPASAQISLASRAYRRGSYKLSRRFQDGLDRAVARPIRTGRARLTAKLREAGLRPASFLPSSGFDNFYIIVVLLITSVTIVIGVSVVPSIITIIDIGIGIGIVPG
jgi:hypothetical protein